MSTKINNEAKVTGRFAEGFVFSHEVLGEAFYRAKVAVERASGTLDIVPIMVSERLVDVRECVVGKNVGISGAFRSYNMRNEERSSLDLYLFAFEIRICDEFGEDMEVENEIILDGYICKDPVYRETPMGRTIADVLLAVNRNYGKCDYIPCILWGRNAKYVGNLPVGTHLRITGRIQSREYLKKIDEERSETRTAYEISVARFEVVNDDNAVVA